MFMSVNLKPTDCKVFTSTGPQNKYFQFRILISMGETRG